MEQFLSDFTYLSTDHKINMIFSHEIQRVKKNQIHQTSYHLNQHSIKINKYVVLVSITQLVEQCMIYAKSTVQTPATAKKKKKIYVCYQQIYLQMHLYQVSIKTTTRKK